MSSLQKDPRYGHTLWLDSRSSKAAPPLKSLEYANTNLAYQTAKSMPSACAMNYPFWFGVDVRCEQMERRSPEDLEDPFIDAVDYVYSRLKYCLHPQHASMLWSEITSNKHMKTTLLHTLEENFSVILETLVTNHFIVAVPHEKCSSPLKSRLARFPLHNEKLPFLGSQVIMISFICDNYQNWMQTGKAI